MNRWFRMLALAAALVILPKGSSALAAERLASHKTDPPLEIRALIVNGQPLALRPGEKLRLSSSPRDITFGFGPATNSPGAPLRIRYKLDGFEENWREASSDMTVSLRFLDSHLDPVAEKVFRAAGQAEGWSGTLESSIFVHRHEIVEVPPGAKKFWLAVSSAGPPTTVGIYAITNLVIARLGTNDQPAQLLLYWGADAKGGMAGTEWVPADWHRNGLRISMARVAQFGPHQEFKALTLLDNDPTAHAEWDSDRESAPTVRPGEHLLFEWDETYSLGMGGYRQIHYAELPAGFYRFQINELSLLGVPGEAEASLAFEVPASFWHTVWFWGLVGLLFLSAAGGAHRYLVLQQTRRQLARLETQHALEHERLRIARDIHDDLGARVTQIALISGMAQADRALSGKARADFNSISGMAHELVSALYENVWAVNPKNDNLDALGNYICQMVDRLCENAQLPHRLKVAELPSDVPVSSQLRHNLILAVKEAVHNVIKHARASELSVSVDWDSKTLTIEVVDNGSGMDPARAESGNGLANMRRRLESSGGTFSLRSTPGGGTTVIFRTAIRAAGC